MISIHQRAMAEAFELVTEANRTDIPGAPAALSKMLDLLGLGSLAEEEGPQIKWPRSFSASASEPAPQAISPGLIGSASSSSNSAGRSAILPMEPTWFVRMSAAEGQIIYGRRPVTEAGRGQRRVRRIWRTPQTTPAELERLCGSADHQGVVAELDPYPYADPRAPLRQPDALLLALDQVQDPRNLGAILPLGRGRWR